MEAFCSWVKYSQLWKDIECVGLYVYINREHLHNTLNSGDKDNTPSLGFMEVNQAGLKYSIDSNLIKKCNH